MAVSEPSLASISTKAGRSVSSRRSPASVGATLRVVRVAERGLGHAQFGGGAGKAGFLGHGEEFGQIAQIVALHRPAFVGLSYDLRS